MADLDDPALKERIAGLKVIRDQAKVDAERAEAMLESSAHQAVSPAMIRTFAAAARAQIRIRRGRLSAGSPARAGPARRGR